MLICLQAEEKLRLWLKPCSQFCSVWRHCEITEMRRGAGNDGSQTHPEAPLVKEPAE